MPYQIHVFLNSRLDDVVPALEVTIACECARDRDPATQLRSLKAVCWNGGVRGGMEASVFIITSIDKKSLTEPLHVGPNSKLGGESIFTNPHEA